MTLTAPTFHSIAIKGRVPAKKNNWRPRKGGGIYCSVDHDLDPLLFQVQSQWKRKPLERAIVSAVFTVPNGKADLDNMYTTLQDLLVKGGVIRNDSIARVAAFSAKAVVGKVAGVRVEIAEVGR